MKPREMRATFGRRVHAHTWALLLDKLAMADRTTSDPKRRRDSRSRSPDSSRRSRHRSRSPPLRNSRHDDGGSRRADRDKDRDDRRSKDDDRERRRERERDKRDRRDERSDSEDGAGPPEGVKEIGEDDYFLKATELKLWLWEEKGKVRRCRFPPSRKRWTDP